MSEMEQNQSLKIFYCELYTGRLLFTKQNEAKDNIINSNSCSNFIQKLLLAQAEPNPS